MNGTAKGGLPAKDLCGKRRFAETDFRAAAGCLLGCRPVGGSVGFGNIAGVATAVTTGGPGAVFWMWLTAFLSMLIKQVEVILILSGQYFKLLKDYKARYMHIGQVDPNMASFYGDKPEMKAALEKEKAAQK